MCLFLLRVFRTEGVRCFFDGGIKGRRENDSFFIVGLEKGLVFSMVGVFIFVFLKLYLYVYFFIGVDFGIGFIILGNYRYWILKGLFICEF